MDRRALIRIAASLGAAGACGATAGLEAFHAGAPGFVTRDADGGLRLDGRPFRYIGANMPEVTHIRTDWDLEQANRFRLPTTDEIDWMVEAAAQANMKVIRTWCFPSHLQPELPEALHYFRRSPDGRTVTLNEAGFRLFDHFLYRCGQLGVRAQVPFVYLYQARQWADAAGDPHPQLFDLVAKVTDRVNTRTGVRYGDDPMIFAWESGNEARPAARWIAALAAFTKKAAPRQLFMDGRWGGSDVQESYLDPVLARNVDIDVVSVHTYEDRPNGWSTPEAITRLAALMRSQGRALDVGEIGPATTPGELAEILTAVIKQPVAGASWWSFKGARAKGGYTQWNGREWGGNDDLKWPGFVAELDGVATEKSKVDLLCGAAYALDGRSRPARLPRPLPAKLLPISDPGHISWIPGTGEQTAVVQRSTRSDGGFVTIEPAFETFRGSTFGLFNDASAAPGGRYFYRIGSRNSGGAAEWSNVVGPVRPTTAWIVDDFWNLDKTHARSPDVRILSNYDLAPYHSDLSVLRGASERDHVTYGFLGTLRSMLLIANGDTNTVHVDGSVDGVAFRDLATSRKLYPPLHPEFAGNPRVTYGLGPVADIRYLRVRLGAADALTRLEIEYSPEGRSRP